MARLVADRVSAGYGRRVVIEDVSVTVEAGQVVGVIGPNGGGKTTLIRVLAGTCIPSRGSVSCEGEPLQALGRREVARRVAVVPQDPRAELGFTALEVVLMGRAPHAQGFGLPSTEDIGRARAAMVEVEVEALAGSALEHLSGGERQRVFLARALVQDPSVLLLDEPTAHLDLRHQVAVLDIARGRARQGGVAVLAVLHDLNLAARHCDRIVLLAGGRVVATGPPRDVLTGERVAAVFGTGVEVVSVAADGAPIVLPRTAADA